MRICLLEEVVRLLRLRTCVVTQQKLSKLFKFSHQELTWTTTEEKSTACRYDRLCGQQNISSSYENKALPIYGGRLMKTDPAQFTLHLSTK